MNKPNSLDTMTKSLSHALSVALHRGLPESVATGPSTALQQHLRHLELESTSDASARALLNVFAEMDEDTFAEIHAALLSREPKFPSE